MRRKDTSYQCNMTDLIIEILKEIFKQDHETVWVLVFAHKVPLWFHVGSKL